MGAQNRESEELRWSGAAKDQIRNEGVKEKAKEINRTENKLGKGREERLGWI
jgi:hypothetical protein